MAKFANGPLCTLASLPVTRCQVSRDLDIRFPPGAKMFTGSGVEYRGYKIIYVRYLNNSMEAFKGLKKLSCSFNPFFITQLGLMSEWSYS